MQADMMVAERNGNFEDAPHGATHPNRRPTISLIRLLVPRPLRAPLLRASGWATAAACLAGTVSLATWTISDPSLTFANGQEAENWLGFWGASFADLSMQFLGFASLLLLAIPFIWSLSIIRSRSRSRLARRIGFGVAALGCASTALACLPVADGWPLHVGLGGVVGDAIMSVPSAFLGDYPGGILAFIIGLLFAATTVWLALSATDLIGPHAKASAQTEPETPLTADAFDTDLPDEEARDWSGFLMAPVGLLAHCFYSAKAAIDRRRAERSLYAPAPAPQPAPQPAAAPGFDTGQSTSPDFTASGSFVSPDQVEVNLAQDMQMDIDGDAVPTNFADHRVVLDRGQHDADDEAIPHTDAAAAAPKKAAPTPAPTRKTVARTPSLAGDPANFELPSLDLLSEQKAVVQDPTLSTEALENNARELEGVLEDFGVKGQIIKVRPGPVVTLYELEPAAGVKSSRVIGLAEDIARSMSAIAARVAVVPGRNAIGIELPNKRRETVYLREQLASKEFSQSKGKLPMCLGKTIGGEPVIADMAKMPHLLVAGTTGSGKSVAINTMILSLLYKHGPDRCKLIMIDPKMLELSIYEGIPHLLTPVVIDPKKAVVALKWTVREMEDRYKKMSKVGVRNIDGFNAKVAEFTERGEPITRTVQTGFDRDTGEAIYETEEMELEALPYIVVVIDEMADLMMVAGKDIEGTVQRLAQMARAAGIHVIMATQRPSTDVITGTIKANFPTRISFQVTSKIDSRVMLGESGAEQLLGMGDMLYMAGGGRITRVHGPFVDDQEVEDIVKHLKMQGVPQYLEAITEEDDEDLDDGDGGGSSGGGNMGDSDDPYDQAVAVVLRDRKVSTSYIQRRLSIGYNRAASLIERMELEGLISAANHAGKREILVPAEDETI
ncbi:MAG: DNA translocase FtsK [Pseudomonadota bacterium]